MERDIAQIELMKAIEEREAANQLSIRRAHLAPVIGNLISRDNPSFSTRVLHGLALVSLWYTDRQDGQLGRSSVKRALSVFDSDIEGVSDLPEVAYLIDPLTSAEGARLDEESDKSFSNHVIEGLLERAIKESDFLTATILKVHINSTLRRDQLMRQVRQLGRENNIDVKANKLGKAKTVMQAMGTVITTISRRFTGSHRFGIGLIAGSNIPSWAAYFQMKRHVNKFINKPKD